MKKILIIDDSKFFREQLKLSLSAEYEVIEAGTGTEGIEMAKLEKPDLVLLDIILPDLSGFDICSTLRKFKEDTLLPIIIITSKDEQNDVLTGFELGADDYIKKPICEQELLARIRNLFRRIERNRNANPLTGLDGNPEIQREIQDRISTGQKFGIIYADLDNFKAYNDVYGFGDGDRLIIMTAGLIRDQAGLWGNPDDFVGHIGGDDFVLVTTPDKVFNICEMIIAEFDEKVKDFYSENDRARGYIETRSRKGIVERFPLMSISLAIMTNERREIKSVIEIGDIAAELKQKLKEMAGSNFFLDRRNSDRRSSVRKL